MKKRYLLLAPLLLIVTLLGNMPIVKASTEEPTQATQLLVPEATFGETVPIDELPALATTETQTPLITEVPATEIPTLNTDPVENQMMPSVETDTENPSETQLETKDPISAEVAVEEAIAAVAALTSVSELTGLDPIPGTTNPIITKDIVTDRTGQLGVAEPYIVYEDGVYHMF